MIAKKKPGAPLGVTHQDKDETRDHSQVRRAGQPLSFPFNPSFGSSLLAWVHSDRFPTEGQSAATIANQLKTIKEALAAMEERWRESLEADPDSIPGWQIAPGASVRVIEDSAREAWATLKGATGIELSLGEFLSCCSVSLRALEEWLIDKEGISPDQAKVAVTRALEELISYRQNRPSLRRLNSEAAYAQRERLEEGREDEGELG